MLGPSSPPLTLLSSMSDGVQDLFPDLVGDDLAFDWGTILNTPQPSRIPTEEKTDREARKLLEKCLKELIGSKSPEYVSEATLELESVAVQSYGEQVMRHMVQLYSNSASDPSFHLLRYAVYLSSNNLLSNNNTDMLLKWVIKNNMLWVLERMMDAKLPTTEVFAANIFVSAARLGHPGAVRALLAKDVDPNTIVGSSSTRPALQEATMHGNMEVVELLLDAGADPNALEGGPFRKTALEIAISLPVPNSALVKLLISRGAVLRPEAARYQGTVLQNAVQLGDTDLVCTLLRAGARVADTTLRWGTALQIAARCGTVDIVEALLEAGADVDSPLGEDCEDGADVMAWPLFFLTPLQVATIKDHTEVVQILLDAGAGVNYFPAAKYSDFTSFCFKGRYDHCESDFESDRGSDGGSDCGSDGEPDREPDCEPDCEPGSATDDESDVVSVCESNTFRPNGRRGGMQSDLDFATGRCFLTPLQAAVSNNNMILVRLFLSHGAEVDTIGGRGTALQIAASEPGRFKLVQLLLRKGADVNSPATVPGGRTALQAAAGSGDEQTVELLLQMGANVNAPAYRRGGCTAVQAAARSGHLAMVKLLVAAGADVHAAAAHVSGRTCLQSAARKGDMGIVDYLLQLGVNINEPACPINGRTALLFAIENHHKSLAERLLEKGADPNGRPSGRCGVTPLQAAVKNKWYDFAQLLLRQGVNPNRNLSSSTPLGIALHRNAVEMVRHLIDAGADANERCADLDSFPSSPLEIAVANGSIDIVRNLLDAGARIDGMCGIIPLHAAVERNSLEIVTMLLLKGVSPNPRPDHDRKSVLLKAICRSPINEDMVRLLVDSGARLDADNGVSLCYAAKKGSLQAVEILLQAGADVNARPWGPHRRTALQEAVIYGNFDIAATLLDRGADVDAPLSTELGGTLLQRAAASGSVRMVQLLLAHGADVNAPQAILSGATALQAAVIRGHFRIVFMLLNSGADINAPGAVQWGRTALEVVAEHGRMDIMHLLLQKYGDVDDMEAQCRRAATLASSEGHVVIARMLREWKRPAW
ncbi:hypothetical protein SPBR_01276 [Sporothrix brasiliensis 5110]|uniref:Uncharacterized protein n=1 Tax=Sporothrix brasiliensis 5110 TaxID=1398154 RepID=A0A0C2IWN4_9PEZI|nr:uncharacterized protein SPBR_01276 [Sporothrix brasiliensis 5110]KIH91135.1 hypothetical protein SPBR_01276 [Sporothrix brasiliensis 5110]